MHKPTIHKPRMTAANLARLLCYGAQWVNEEKPLDPDSRAVAYRIGSLEAVAHLGACVITQDLTGEPTDTGEIRDLLADFPSVPVLTKRIQAYVKEVEAYKTAL